MMWGPVPSVSISNSNPPQAAARQAEAVREKAEGKARKEAAEKVRLLRVSLIRLFMRFQEAFGSRGVDASRRRVVR